MALYRRGPVHPASRGGSTRGLIIAMAVIAIVALLLLAGYLVSMGTYDGETIQPEPTNAPPAVTAPKT